VGAAPGILSTEARGEGPGTGMKAERFRKGLFKVQRTTDGYNSRDFHFKPVKQPVCMPVNMFFPGFWLNSIDKSCFQESFCHRFADCVCPKPSGA